MRVFLLTLMAASAVWFARRMRGSEIRKHGGWQLYPPAALIAIIAGLLLLTACGGGIDRVRPGAQTVATSVPIAVSADPIPVVADPQPDPPAPVDWFLIGYLFVIVTETAFIRLGPLATGRLRKWIGAAIVFNLITTALLAILHGMSGIDVLVGVVMVMLAIASASRMPAPVAVSTAVKP